jgi:sugar O-acyltransferase (sialic acid O-acetyltransferase NeuD family)
MSGDLVLIGFGGNTLEVLEAAQAQIRVVAILSDDPGHGAAFEGIPIRPVAEAKTFTAAAFLFLIGSERSYRTRLDLLARLSLGNDRFATLIHERASVSRFARIGSGSVLFQGVTVTSNAVLGRHVLVLPQCVIHHDVKIGEGAILGATVTVAGGVTIEDGAYIGSGTSIRNGIRIGAGALIGLGSVVVRDVAPGSVVAGNPARVLRAGPP